MTLALALVWAVALAPADSTCPGGVVLNAADLEAGGVVAVHDLARLVPFIDVVSVDGYDAEPLTAWGTPRPLRVLVDGIPTASTTALEPLGLEPLPVAVGEIRRVVVCPGPGLAGGAWGGPWMDIETAPPVRVYAAGLYVNETGDPGPDLYRDPTLRNVDRWGPDAEAALGARVGGTQLWASGRVHRILPTDSSIAPRILDVSVPGPNPVRLGTVAAVSARRPGAALRLGIHRAADLPFLPTVGREVPADRQTVQASLKAEHRGLRAHLHLADLSLDRPDGSRLALGTDGLGPAWSERRIDAAASLALAPLTLGVQADWVQAAAPGLDDRAAATGRVWALWTHAVERGEASLALQTTASEFGLALGGTATVRRRLDRGAEVTATVALDRPTAADAPEAWLRRGYTGLDGALTLDAASAPTPAVAVARIGVSGGWGGVQASAAAEGQWARGTVEVARLDLDGAAAVGRVGFESATGTAGRLRARLAWRGGAWRVTASGRLQGALGDASHRDAWARVARAQGDVRVAFRPDTRLTLWAAARTRSGARWAGYPDPDVPAVLLVDLGLTKRAWGQRLALTLVGRNVLDAPERTHPLGAVLAARLFIRAALRL